ncbi:flagellar basal body rod protein FlgB [Mediterraneibacter sp. NSJ-55]|uniref:Flagellar basal body rod protein FlgB n=1 Tax=Mediterraneibacter hominis TaxID=2763054 RepID=A0A923LJX9_9FIRM|nr:flagellar basal body rod protein FlgB [Mediterraneibacter hominis]MBC5689331.1 flagellar basal body rod protein FlgB [Mediterraneibacter hominis]
MTGIYGNTINMAEKTLDFLWKKESVISNNLANVETPGYKAKYVTFEEEFKSRIDAAARGKNTDVGNIRRAIEESVYRVHVSQNETARADGNNVNADTEIMELTRAALQYQYLLSSVNADITRLNAVIKGQ